MSLYVGTSGWDYAEWRGGFYPDGLPQRRFLEHYARTLGACEVNATFHRLHSPEAVERWQHATPTSFRFAAKVHRRLTHTRRLRVTEPWRAFAERFFASVDPLGEQLACLLLQFPPHIEREDGALEALLAELPSDRRFALEFRHESWAAPDVADRLARADATMCLSNTDGAVPGELPPGPLAYVRLRAERYSERERDGWLALLEREAAQRDVYAFAKHEGVPVGDPFTGVGLAQWLTSRSRATDSLKVE
jgi:uncharacterized protein YecE (DUF72 family)